ncbi:MAG: hypothetical protein J0M08_13825 [Bacteroidetes bacterium]|nr:hypothetical protein [Bacteroidota bacterium]
MMGNRINYFLFTLIVVLISNTSFLYSQEDAYTLLAKTIVVDRETGKKLDGVRISILENRGGNWIKLDENIVDKKGFNFDYLLQKEYIVSASKKGYIKKKVLISTVMDGASEKPFAKDIEISLSINIINLKDTAAVLDIPYGKLIYDKKKDDFVADIKYDKEIRAQAKKVDPVTFERIVARIKESALSTGEPPSDIKELVKNVEKPVESKPTPTVAVTPTVAETPTVASTPTVAAQTPTLAATSTVATTPTLAVKQATATGTTTTTLEPAEEKPIATQTVAPVEKKPVTKLDFLRQDVTDKKTIEALTVRSEQVGDIVKLQKAKAKVEKNKVKNLSAKYETGNALTKLYDEVDMYYKNNRK